MILKYKLQILLLLIGNSICYAQSHNTQNSIQWQQTPHTQSFDIIYLKDALKISTNGAVITGLEAITTYYKDLAVKIKSTHTIKKTPALSDSSIIYEIGEFITIENKIFKQLIIWKKEHSMWKRELEIVQESIKTPAALGAIDQRRAEWIKYCNLHQTADLINNLYAPDAIYYNHKPLVIGRSPLISEYSYMNKANYHLNLKPLHVEQVTDTIVFEIGQGSGSYNGKYIIVWKKDASGTWYVYFDSNI